jgi:hypothetical protein
MTWLQRLALLILTVLSLVGAAHAWPAGWLLGLGRPYPAVLAAVALLIPDLPARRWFAEYLGLQTTALLVLMAAAVLRQGELTQANHPLALALVGFAALNAYGFLVGGSIWYWRRREITTRASQIGGAGV